MILNKTNYPCLYDDGSVDYENNPRAHRFKNLNDFNYWYIEVLYTWRVGDDLIKNFEDFIPPEILENIKHDSETKLLLYSVEPMNVIVENIYQFITKFGIPESKILLMCELIDINAEVESVAKKYNLACVETCYAAVDEVAIAIQIKMKALTFYTLTTLEKKSYDKAYINLNRKWRTHRPLFVSLLCCHDLLDKGYVSLSSTTDFSYTWPDTVSKLVESITDSDIHSILTDNYDKISNLPDLIVDTNDLSFNPVRLDDFSNTVDFYKNSYFSVVSETCFYEDVGRFLTEKTFKAIAHKHPFLMISSPGTLTALRDMGYKTFHPFIDETYDEVDDHLTRMKMIVAETKRLASFSESELFEWIDHVKPIVEHNFRVLASKPNFLKVN